MKSTPATHPGATSRPLAVLVALLTLATIELIRSSGPLLDMAFTEGVMAAAGAALLTYAAAGLLAGGLLLATRRRPVRCVVVGAVVLALARLGVQALEAGARFGVGLATVALAIAVLTVAVAALANRVGGARDAVAALALGAAAAIGLQLTLGTWDAFWRHDVTGWAVTVLLAAAVVLAALTVRRVPDAGGAVSGRLWVLGPVLGLMAMMLANPAFAASQADAPLAVAGPLIGVGWLLAAWVARQDRVFSPRLEATALPVLVAAGLLGARLTVLMVLLVIPVVLAPALVRALAPRGDAASALRIAGAASLVGLGTILPLLVHQLDYDVPLGFPNWLVLVATAALVGVGSLRRGPAETAPKVAAAAEATEPETISETLAAAAVPRAAVPRWHLAAGALLVVGAAVSGVGALTSAPPPAAPDEITLVSWNLHYGVDAAGDVDLEQIAATIAAQDPDVVTLQEVSRGWILGGGSDMATWLANRLDMDVAFAPAADRQFGNVVLTHLPFDDVTVLSLPYGAGPQRRSALSVDVAVGDGHLRVTSVHLQHRETNTPTRLEQIRTLLDAAADGPWLLAGDLNAEPGWPEIDLLSDAGLVSAIDAAGDPSALTSPSADPQFRIDWVFGRDIAFTSAEVRPSLASDHLPLVVRFLAEP